MTVGTSWARIVDWVAANQPATVPHINPPATAVDLRYLQAAMNRPLPADLVEYLQIADGTEHRYIRGSLIPPLYNLVPVMDMLSTRKMLREIQRSIYGAGPWPDDVEPAGRPTMNWLDSFLPIALPGDAGCLYVDLRDGDEFGCVVEWYPEGGMASAPHWGAVGEMLDDVAGAMVDGQPALTNRDGQLPEVDDGYLSWT